MRIGEQLVSCLSRALSGQPIFETEESRPEDIFEGASIVEIESKLGELILSNDRRKNALEISNAIVSCVSPLLSKPSVSDEQIWLVLLRIMSKIQSERQSSEHEASRLDRVRRSVVAAGEKLDAQAEGRLKAVLAKLDGLQGELKSQRQDGGEEANMALGTVSSVMRARHEAVMNAVREIRA